MVAAVTQTFIEIVVEILVFWRDEDRTLHSSFVGHLRATILWGREGVKESDTIVL